MLWCTIQIKEAEECSPGDLRLWCETVAEGRGDSRLWCKGGALDYYGKVDEWAVALGWGAGLKQGQGAEGEGEACRQDQ